MRTKIKGVDGSVWELEQDIVYDKKTGVMKKNTNAFKRSNVEGFNTNATKSRTILIILFCILIAICLLPFVLGYRFPYSSHAMMDLSHQFR